MRGADDRAAMARTLIESLGGSLECVYWEVSTRAAHAIADMPDSTCAAALTTVLSQTGAFKDVESCELFTQDQLTHVLSLAADVSQVYQVPGQRLHPDDADAPPHPAGSRRFGRGH
jgi:uncharacterized protein with GYD domain